MEKKNIVVFFALLFSLSIVIKIICSLSQSTFSFVENDELVLLLRNVLDFL